MQQTRCLQIQQERLLNCSVNRLPTRPQTPIIMIGPGTGLAPFRGFIQERAYLKDEGKPVGESILYFGCRKKAEDFIYQEEIEEYVKKDVLKVFKS